MQIISTGNLSQAVQTMVNVSYFEGACIEFEKMLSEKRSSHQGSQVKLQATGTFKKANEQAQKKITGLVSSKINDFLELAEYDL